MVYKPANEPTVEELATKAFQTGVVDDEFANYLRSCEDLDDALGAFYTHIIDKGGDPESLLEAWDIVSPNE